MSEAIDYRSLLVKYMAGIISRESVDLIDALEWSGIEVTKEEIEELRQLSPEARELSV